MVNNLRFVILGDDRGSRAFDSFSRSVNRSNRAVDQNRTMLQRLSGQSDKTGKGVLKLTGTISGFSDAMSVGSKNTGMFAKVMAGLSLATGLLEPPMAGLVVAAGGLAAGLAAAGTAAIAFGAVAGPNISKAATAAQAAQTAQDQYKTAVTAATAAYQHQMTTASTKAQRAAAETRKASALQAAWKARVQATTAAYQGLTPAQVQLSKNIGAMTGQWQKFTASFAPKLNQVMKQVRPLFAAILPDLRKLATAGFTGISTLLSSLGSANTAGLTRFINMLARNAPEAIVRLGVAIGHIGTGIAGILRAFMPVSQGMLKGLDAITARFAKWGQTLSGHSGFASLMEMFRKDTPVVNQVLKNLAVILKNVVSAMAGFSSPSNSLGLLNTLQALSGIIARLSANKQLMNLVLTFLLWSSIARKVLGPLAGIGQAVSGIGKTYGTIKSGVTLLGRFRDGFTNANAAASEFSGTAGTMGGKVRSAFSAIGSGAKAMWGLAAAASAATFAWVKNSAAIVWNKTVELAQAAASKVAAAAQWLWNAALSANPIGLVIIAVGALVAAVIYAYKHFRWFRDFVNAVWRDIRAWTAGAWHAILGAIKATWNWVKRNWPLLLGILTGPIGAAVILIIRYRDVIWNGIRAVWRWIGSAWGHVQGWLSVPVRAAGRIIGGIFGAIRGAARAVWSWISSAWQRITGWLTAPFRKAWHVIKGIWDAIAAIIRKITSFGGGSSPTGGGVPGRYTGGSSGTSAGAAQAYAARVLPGYGWDPAQMNPLVALWNQESGWRWNAQNPTSGAYGIPQSLPASKMASAGSDWRTNPATQIRWGLGYIKGRYGSPAGAWSHEQAFNWYARGGAIREPVLGVGLRTGRGYGFGEKGRSEYVGGSDMNAQLDQLIGRVDDLIGAVYDSAGRNAGDTAAGMAAALGVAGSRAAMRARYSPV
jgi:hypothetical protein